MTLDELTEEFRQAAMRVDAGKATQRDFEVLACREYQHTEDGHSRIVVNVRKAIAAGLLDPGEGL